MKFRKERCAPLKLIPSVEGYVLLNPVVGYQALGGADGSVKHARFRTTT